MKKQSKVLTLYLCFVTVSSVSVRSALKPVTRVTKRQVSETSDSVSKNEDAESSGLSSFIKGFLTDTGTVGRYYF